MTAITAGEGRFVKLDAAANVVTGSESAPYDLAELDNTAAPRVVLNKPEAATADDLPDSYLVKFDGSRNELLEFQVNADVADIFDTGDTAALKFPIKRAIRDEAGRYTYVDDFLALADRITPAGGAGLSHRSGLADDAAYGAGVWVPYLRFSPPENEVWILSGRMKVDVHNDTP